MSTRTGMRTAADCPKLDRRGWRSADGVRDILLVLALVGVTVAVYAQTCHFGIVTFDDPDYTTDNKFVRSGLSASTLAWAFQTTFFANWHPLTWLSYMLDVELYGNWAGGFHLTNVILHTANVLLLYFVFKQMTGAPYPSATVAALFAVHPLHVESVAWVSERKDVLSTFFGLLSLWAYARYARSGSPVGESDLPKRWIWYAAALFAFAASLLSKQMLVTLPFALLLLDYWPLDRRRESWKRLVAEKLPFLLLSAAASAVTFIAQTKGGAVQSLDVTPFPMRLANAVVTYVLYLWKAVWPQNLAALYPFPSDGIPMAQVAGAGLLLVAVTVLVWSFRKKSPYLLVGWLWYLGTLVPVIGLVQVGSQRMADRYAYIPLIGIDVAVAWLAWTWAVTAARKSVVAAATVGLVALLAATAHQQVHYWRDSVALFQRALDVTGHSAIAYNNVGAVLLDARQFDKALVNFQNAARLDPNYAIAQNNLGLTFENLKNLDEAIRHYEAALRIAPGYAKAHGNLANALREANRPDDAIKHYRRALELDPVNKLARVNLGNLLRGRGNPDAAIEQYKQLLDADPDNVAAHVNLGIAIYAQGRPNEAELEFVRAIEIDPNSASAHLNLGVLYNARGNFLAAIQQFRTVLNLSPSDANAQHYLSSAYVSYGSQQAVQGRLDEAVGLFQQAITVEDANWQAHYNLAKAFVLRGMLEQAEAEFHRTVQLKPDLAEARRDLQQVRDKIGKQK